MQLQRPKVRALANNNKIRMKCVYNCIGTVGQVTHVSFRENDSWLIELGAAEMDNLMIFNWILFRFGRKWQIIIIYAVAIDPEHFMHYELRLSISAQSHHTSSSASSFSSSDTCSDSSVKKFSCNVKQGKRRSLNRNGFNPPFQCFVSVLIASIQWRE